MSPTTLSLLQRFHQVLGLPPMTDDILQDPLSTDRPNSSVAAVAGNADEEQLGPRQVEANSGTSRAIRRSRGAESTDTAA